MQRSVPLTDIFSLKHSTDSCLFQLGISPEYQPFYVIYHQVGDSTAGPPLSDERIVTICRTYGDEASTLRFSIQPSQAAMQSPPMSTQSMMRGLPPSRIPTSSNQAQSPNQMIPHLSIDTSRLGASNGIPIDRVLPPIPNITPPIPPLHTRPIPSSAQYQNQPNGYMMPPNSAHDDQSEVNSGYSGGAEDTPHHPFNPGSSHLAALARIKSKVRMNIPNLPNPPMGPPPPPPSIHSSPPASTVATIGPSRISDKDRAEFMREKEIPLSLPTSSGPSSRSNIPPPAPPPTHLPPPPPVLSSSNSSDSRRPPETSRSTRPGRGNEGSEDRGREQDREWVWVDNRPATSNGYDPPIAAPYERPGTSTGMYPDQLSRGERPPLSPMARSTSSDGRPRDPWAPGSVLQYDRPNGARQNGTSHTGIGLRIGFSPKNPAHATPINVVNGQRSPQNNGTAGGYVAGPRGITANDGYGMQNMNQGQAGYNTPSKRDGRRMPSNGEGTPIVRTPIGKGLRSPNSGMVNPATYYHPSVASAQGQSQGQTLEQARAEATASNRAARIGAYGETRGLSSSRSQDNLRHVYLYGSDYGPSSTASTPGIGAGGNVDMSSNGTAGNNGSRLSPVGRGTNSRLPPPPMNAQLYINSDLPPTPSSFANHPYAPRSPTTSRQLQQVALNSSVGNGSHRSPITQPSRQPNPRDLYAHGVGDRVGHPFASRTSAASPQTTGSTGMASPRQRNRTHAASDAYASPPSPPVNGQGQMPSRLHPNPNSTISASTSAPASTLNLSILPPGPPPPQGHPPPLPAHRPSISDPKYIELPPGAMDPNRKRQQQQQQSGPYDSMGGLPSPPSAASPTPPTRLDSIAKSARLLNQNSGGGSLSGHTSSPAASPASPRTPLLGESEYTVGVASPRRRRMMELVNGEEEGTVKVQDFVNNRQWREGFLAAAASGGDTLMQRHFGSTQALQRSGNDSSRNGSQSPGTPVARSPLQQPSNAPWNAPSEEEDEDDDDDYENDPSASDGANNLWQKPLVKRISRIYKMGKSLRMSTQSSMSRRNGDRSGDGFDDFTLPALPTLEEPSDQMSGTSSRKNGGVPMETIDLGGTVFSFRPAAEQVLDQMDNFFPDHDLDKPIMDSSNNNTGTSGNNSGGSSPTMVDAPYSTFANAGLSAPSSSGTHAVTPTGSPIIGGSTITGSPSPMGITRQRQKKTIRTLAGQGKRKMDRMSKDGAASDTMLRRRSTKFWGNSIRELQPAEFERLANMTPESPGGGNKPEVMQWFKGKLLGKGTYGKVYLGFNATSKEVFAVKRVEMPESRSDHQDPRQKQVLDAIKSESDTLRDLDHPNIVAYLGYEQTEKYFSM